MIPFRTYNQVSLTIRRRVVYGKRLPDDLDEERGPFDDIRSVERIGTLSVDAVVL